MKNDGPTALENDLDDLAREFNKEERKAVNDGDSSDEFGVFDPTKHVSFDEKVKLAD